MELKAQYNAMYYEAILQIKQDAYVVDDLLHSQHDKRLGITLLIRPPEAVKQQIQKFLSEIKAVDANQYYYPNSDIHITVLSIISCYNGFQLDQISVEDYIQVIETSLKDMPAFRIQFKGITASPSCVMIQGFLETDTLNLIRDRLRFHFKNTALEQSIDIRYAVQTAHSTVVRFTNTLQHKNEFLNVIEAYRHFDFGSFKVQGLELVYNDWYQREDRVKCLHRFNLE
ncbi:2'-5' RNA ligase family protein [Formosa haliotis]|uniref:2'-5' RNA ligase family protein n=1 Tax=Formosa haliotis TaxID=1555194 RepID=UPI0008245DF6|nr:2'-5' RNA ligase family protein [Formosa haliotis]